jgi:hypothetical protein
MVGCTPRIDTPSERTGAGVISMGSLAGHDSAVIRTGLKSGVDVVLGFGRRDDTRTMSPWGLSLVLALSFSHPRLISFVGMGKRLGHESLAINVSGSSLSEGSSDACQALVDMM